MMWEEKKQQTTSQQKHKKETKRSVMMANYNPNTSGLVSLADRPNNDRTTIAEQGGVASGVARREKKLLRELATEALLKELPTGETVQGSLINRLTELCMDDKTRPAEIIKCMEFLWKLSCQYNTDKKYDPTEPEWNYSALWEN